eukprot:431508_1
MKQVLKQKKVKSLTNYVTDKIQQIFDSFDIELLCYQIKNGKRDKIVQQFNDHLMKKVQDLMKNNKQDGFVENVYEFVTKWFLSKNELGLNEWICGNC